MIYPSGEETNEARPRGHRPRVSGMALTSHAISVPSAPAWTADALCAQTDPELFFPEQGGSTLAPKRICADCEVRAQCLDWAFENNDQYGIYGGLSARERARLKRGAA